MPSRPHRACLRHRDEAFVRQERRRQTDRPTNRAVDLTAGRERSPWRPRHRWHASNERRRPISDCRPPLPPAAASAAAAGFYAETVRSAASPPVSIWLRRRDRSDGIVPDFVVRRRERERKKNSSSRCYTERRVECRATDGSVVVLY